MGNPSLPIKRPDLKLLLRSKEKRKRIEKSIRVEHANRLQLFQSDATLHISLERVVCLSKTSDDDR